jgi:ubiquinone biosynthesis protein COQ4
MRYTKVMDQATGRPERIKPVAALLAVSRLLRDPQDTSQVFRLTQALRGRSAWLAYLNFANSSAGARILASRRALIDTLSDRAKLAALPEGSFGRAYLTFMEAEQLTAEGLVELAEQNLNLPASASEPIRLYAARMRDLHDLYHVLTGYGRDELGEVCVLAFSYPQQRIRSFWVISRLGALHVWRGLRKAGLSGRGVLGAVREAARHGASATWLPGEEIEALLTENLESLRERLNIPAPEIYLGVIARIRRATGIFSGPFHAAMDTRGR